MQENVELINNNNNLIISNDAFNDVVLHKIVIPYYNGYVSFDGEIR